MLAGWFGGRAKTSIDRSFLEVAPRRSLDGCSPWRRRSATGAERRESMIRYDGSAVRIVGPAAGSRSPVSTRHCWWLKRLRRMPEFEQSVAPATRGQRCHEARERRPEADAEARGRQTRVAPARFSEPAAPGACRPEAERPGPGSKQRAGNGGALIEILGRGTICPIAVPRSSATVMSRARRSAA